MSKIKTVLLTTGWLLVLIGPQARAGSATDGVYWDSYRLAATCSYDYPSAKPLAVSRTLVVDKNAPDGTVLFSWGYGEFWSDLAVTCTDSGITHTSLNMLGPGAEPVFSTGASLLNSDVNGLMTSDSGIRLKLWARFNTSCDANGNPSSSAYSSDGSGTNVCPAAGTEVLLYSTGTASYSLLPLISAGIASFPTGSASISFRAELIKYGTVSYSSPLTINAGINPSFRVGSNSFGSSHQYHYDGLSGSGIQIVSPSCQLKNTDYNIPMGLWVDKNTTPAWGPQVPVNLSLKCSGSVDHVRFRFEDTGSSLSDNKNISLYSTSGGSKIEGLEIEMLYNGTKVDVDNSTLTDTGSHGAFVSASEAFDSESTAAFHARYVQNSAITRAGTDYTGAVTGKVNMYVTYD